MSYKSDKLGTLFATKDWSDCIFLIDKQEIRAHKLILACSSPVFESMFYGNLSSTKIVIEDIDGDCFKNMLEYIYTEKIAINSIDEAWSLFYASQKYFLLELQEMCKHYIKSHLSINNLLLSYEYSELYNQTELMQKCLNDIISFTRGIVLYSNYHIKAETLNNILKDSRGVNMNDLLLLAVNWGLEECNLKGVMPNKETICEVFEKNDISNKLYFLNFQFHINKGINKSLTKDQLYSLYHIVDICDQIKEDLINNSICKKKIIQKPLNFKYRKEYKNSIQFSLDQSQIFTQVASSNKDCLIFGLTVTTRSKPDHMIYDCYFGRIDIYIYLKLSDHISHLIYEHRCAKQCLFEYNSSQNVVFDVPVLFEANKKYMICIEYLESDETYNKSVLMKFMSDLFKNKCDTVIRFENESMGGVITGACFYEA